jgi:hypothetical protein
MPVMTTCTLGSVVTMRPLPSLVTSAAVPVSAIRKLAPEMPISARQEMLAQHRAGLPGHESGMSAEVRVSTGPAVLAWRIGPRPRPMVLCTAGAMMCDGASPASWTMYSPRSVSTGRMPAAAKRFVEVVPPRRASTSTWSPWSRHCAGRCRRHMAAASSPSRAHSTSAPVAVARSSKISSQTSRSATTRRRMASQALRTFEIQPILGQAGDALGPLADEQRPRLAARRLLQHLFLTFRPARAMEDAWPASEWLPSLRPPPASTSAMMQDPGPQIAAAAQAAFDIEQAAEIAADHGIGTGSGDRLALAVDDRRRDVAETNANAPPNPQHSSHSGISTSDRPRTLASKSRGWLLDAQAAQALAGVVIVTLPENSPGR